MLPLPQVTGLARMLQAETTLLFAGNSLTSELLALLPANYVLSRLYWDFKGKNALEIFFSRSTGPVVSPATKPRPGPTAFDSLPLEMGTTLVAARGGVQKALFWLPPGWRMLRPVEEERVNQLVIVLGLQRSE